MAGRSDGSFEAMRSLKLLAAVVALIVLAGACGDDDQSIVGDVDVGAEDLGGGAGADLETSDGGARLGDDGSGDGDADGDVVDGNGDGDVDTGLGPIGGETATLRMINLVGSSKGGIDVDVVGPAEDISSDYVYGSVRYGEIAEIEFPTDWDARLVRAGTDQAVGGTFTVYDDTEPGRVVVFRDDGASTFGAFIEDRLDGYATLGVVSAIADPDPNRRYRPSDPDGVCLYSVGNEVPAPMATPAEGGDTRGIISLGLLGDFVWYVEPGPQVITYGDAAEDVFSQVDDCSSFAFSAEIDAVEGKAVFVAFYGNSSSVQSTVYYEE
jgi:hypothetical protein